MIEQFLAELRVVSFTFAPQGWALCNGQLLPISQNQALFALLGTTFGGDGVQTFALPNLRGASGMHPSTAHPLGQRTGESAVTLTPNMIPSHQHAVSASSAKPNSPTPAGHTWAANGSPALYGAPDGSSMAPAALSVAGQSAPHNNMPPYLVLNVIIALVGIFPSRN